MNTQITRLAVASIVLIVALVVGTTYWQTWASASLADRQDNALVRVAQFTVDRGKIYAADGKFLLATNVKKKVSGQTYYFRTYPSGNLAPHVVGYSTQSRSRAGLEQSENDYLTGANGSLSSVTQRELNNLAGITVKGNDLLLALNVRAQRTAVQQLAGKCGAAVAIEPQTGRVLVLASSPTYNPNAIEQNFSAITKVTSSACAFAAPLLDRATQGLYPPGSTFKVVTATAALDSGAFTPTSMFNDPGYCTEYGKQVSNAGNPDQNGPESFGNVTLSQGFQHSINSVFCNIGKKIGAASILDYAKKFGFYAQPNIELPADAQSPSGLFDQKTHTLYNPKDPNTQVDPGRLAFGQERLLVTPLQMAMVAATVANGGVLMQPHLIDEVRGPNGSVVARIGPHQVRRVMSQQTADELKQMMISVVTGGTGTTVQIPGVQVAGKTGTAETGVASHYDTWFIAFAPADNPTVAVAVALENQTGFGATTAGPIAKALIEAILASGSNP
ncbi:MAG: peptidoglycan D,D-transpeptidase FtsI family protein [Gaiellaceae bacterium]